VYLVWFYCKKTVRCCDFAFFRCI